MVSLFVILITQLDFLQGIISLKSSQLPHAFIFYLNLFLEAHYEGVHDGRIELKKYCVSSLISIMFQCSRKRDLIAVDSRVLVDIGFVQDIRARGDVVVYKVLNLVEESKEILSYGQISNDSGSIHLCSNGGVLG